MGEVEAGDIVTALITALVESNASTVRIILRIRRTQNRLIGAAHRTEEALTSAKLSEARAERQRPRESTPA